MLQPQQFEVNQAWVTFQLNGQPIRTEADGDFNCFVLMDAASCFILCSEMVPASADEPSELEFRRLLKNAQSRSQTLPGTLLVPNEVKSEAKTQVATEQDIEVVLVPESELLEIIGEARDGFSERFE